MSSGVCNSVNADKRCTGSNDWDAIARLAPTPPLESNRPGLLGRHFFEAPVVPSMPRQIQARDLTAYRV
jgi:hypothetical protein